MILRIAITRNFSSEIHQTLKSCTATGSGNVFIFAWPLCREGKLWLNYPYSLVYWWRSKLTNPQVWRYFQTNSTSLKMSLRNMNKPVQLRVWKPNHQTFCTVNLVFIHATANKAGVVMTFDPIIHTRAQRWASNLQSFLLKPCWHFSAIQVHTVLVTNSNYRYGRKQGSLQSTLWKLQSPTFFINFVNVIFFSGKFLILLF